MLIEVERQNDVCILRFKGRFATGTDPIHLQAKMDEIKSQACTKVLADLRELLSIGSTGIGFLVRIYTSVTTRPEGRFVAVGSNQRVLEVFDLTHLNRVIPLIPDFESGLAMLRGGGAARA